MIDSSEKRDRRLASELQNSHVCEKCDPNLRSTVSLRSRRRNESIFLSRVEGRGFHVAGEGTMSRVEGNIFFFQFFFFFFWKR